MEGHRIPAGEIVVEQEVKRSRFICHLAHCSGREAAMEFIRTISERHRDANHNCWAFVAHAPDDPAGWGMNDDGEPRGCAGKPMFSVLHHHGAGEICAVVSRYFGGIKLGTGGMARAYGGAVRLALEAATFTTKIPTTRLCLTLPYSHQRDVEYLLQAANGTILTSGFTAEIVLEAEIPQATVEEFSARLLELGRGAITISPASFAVTQEDRDS